MTSFFVPRMVQFGIKFRRLVQNDMSTAVMWSNSKPDVVFHYAGRLGEFNGMSPQSHLPHCRVLPHGEFSVMIPELRVTLQGAATEQILWHVIPEPRITLQGAAAWWIHCHDSRATCHIVGCSHLAKSMSWSCHIAGCKNSIRHIENRFRHILFFKCSLGSTSVGFRIVSDTLVSDNLSEVEHAKYVGYDFDLFSVATSCMRSQAASDGNSRHGTAWKTRSFRFVSSWSL